MTDGASNCGHREPARRQSHNHAPGAPAARSCGCCADWCASPRLRD